MAERKEITIDIVLKDDFAAQNVKELKQAVKLLNDEILKTEAGSEAFINASKKAGQLKDKLEDAKDSVKSFNASPIENVANSFGSLGNKLKSLDFGGAKQEFSNLSSSFIGLSKNILGIGQATSAASAGFRILGGAIAATGIGVLVIAIVLLIANFDKLKTAGGLIGETFTKLGNIIQGVIQYVKDLTDSWGLTAFAAQDAAKKQIEAQEKAGKNAEEWYARNGDKFDEFSKRKIEADIEYKKSKLELDKDETKSAEEKAQILKELEDKRNREIKASDTDRRAEITKQNEEEAAKNKAKNDKIKADNEKAAEDKKKKEQEVLDFQKQIQDEINKINIENTQKVANQAAAELDILNQKRTEEENFANFAKEIKGNAADLEFEYISRGFATFKEFEDKKRSELQKIADDEKKALQAKIDLAYSFANTIKGLNQSLNSNFLTGLAGLSDGIGQFLELSKMNFETTTEKVAAYAQAALGVVSNVLSGIQENNQAKLAENLANIQTAADQTIAIEQDKLNKGIISQAEFDKKKQQIDFKSKQAEYKLKKQAFEDDKKLKIVQTIVSGLQGAVSAFAGAMQLGPIAGPVVGGILAAAVAAMTAVNVAKISSTKFGEAAPVMGADTSAATAAAGAAGAAQNTPSPSPTVNDFTAFGTGGGGNNLMANQPVVQAVVLESQITATQLKLAGYKTNSELGG